MGHQLSGHLPCARCRYELRGLSIASNCPECGLPIGVTILAVVDPYAKELQPIARPHLTFAGLMLWASGAMAVALLMWVMHLGSMAYSMFSITLTPSWGPLAICIATLLSGLGAAVLIRPHAKIPRRQILAAAAASAAFLPLAWLHWDLFSNTANGLGFDYFSSRVDSERVAVRLLCGLLGVLITIGLRPNARVLVSRSLVLRTGRMDRQTMYALAAAFGVGVLGDAIQLASGGLRPVRMDVLRSIGVALSVLSALLCTLGLVSIFVDTWRLRRAVLSEPLDLDQLIDPPKPEGSDEPRRA
ncbi:MAG: hypothetical protein KF705_09920 [Phycisphaeraceae bacterium]|nr:hypothetical protein [Phycisphaeraceae bacterium]